MVCSELGAAPKPFHDMLSRGTLRKDLGHGADVAAINVYPLPDGSPAPPYWLSPHTRIWPSLVSAANAKNVAYTSRNPVSVGSPVPP